MQPHVARVPLGRGIDAYLAIVETALRSKRLALAIVLGSLVSGPNNQSRLLSAVARALPASRVVALNLGEFGDATEAAYAELELGLPRSVVGHLYITDPLTEHQKERKTRLLAILRQNRGKAGYKQQIAEDDAWLILKAGCNAWFNPSQGARDAALEWLKSSA